MQKRFECDPFGPVGVPGAKIMSYSPLTFSRRHVLGDLYARCERSTEVPVFLGSVDGEKLGYVDEGLGRYADAFTFHISEENCKKLAAGQFEYSIGYEPASDESGAVQGRRVKLTSITLIQRKAYKKPGSADAAAADPAEQPDGRD